MPSSFAPAKVNLFLHVGPVKPNGRHDLDSLVVFAADIGDTVQVEAGDELTLVVKGPMAGAAALGDTSDNLVLTAAHALAKAGNVSRGAALTLEKHLPVAAGIGGGSADAAAALRALTQHWALDPAIAARLAPSLGGDVPVALGGQAAFMRGEGERVEPLQLPGALPAVLVNPGAACSTGAVFGAFDGEGAHSPVRDVNWPRFPSGDDGRIAFINWLAVQSNDLESAALKVQPAIADVLAALDAESDARLVRMSGSGATCFAVFETLQTARDAAASIATTRPDWWVRAAQLGDAS